MGHNCPPASSLFVKLTRKNQNGIEKSFNCCNFCSTCIVLIRCCPQRLNCRPSASRSSSAVLVGSLKFNLFAEIINLLNNCEMRRQTYNVSGIPGQTVSQNYFYSNQFRNITLFRAFDLNTNGTGGFASIVSGGIGHRNITFNLRASAVGRGYNFFVDCYGV
jgi:Transcription activator MBF2